MERNVLEILEHRVLQYADRIALEDKDTCLTYKEFRKNARSLASGLMEVGKKKTPVVVLADRSISSVVMFWGVVYSGNFYVPVDATLPPERLKLLLSLIEPAAVLAQEKYVQKMECQDIPVFTYEHLIITEEKEEELRQIQKDMIDVDPLYMVFTSGSTGVPKGVVKTHRSVLTFLEDFTDLFQFDAYDVFGNQAEFDFDVSAKNIYTSVYTGGTLCLIPRICFMLPAKLSEFLNQHRITVLIWSASALKYAVNARCFQKEIPRYVNKVLFSGEALPAKVLNSWRSYLPQVMYVNLYAPSEVTGNCLYHVIKEELANDEKIPLGKAFPNMEVLILDIDKKAVGEEGIGEIYVRGAFLSSGYYRDFEKTEQAFIQNPLNNGYLDMVYKTGDLAEKKNGKLYFVSRIDDQIKHMGHRIELGEIESLTEMLENVDGCSAFFDAEQEKIILAVEGRVQDSVILGRLREQLPKYMVPHQVYIREQLPRNSHGKVDKELIKEWYRRGEL